MFALPLGGEAPVEGTSIESPIILEGVDGHHFQLFLRVLYPLYVPTLGTIPENFNMDQVLDSRRWLNTRTGWESSNWPPCGNSQR